MARYVALSFAVLLAVFDTGSCLKCYVCKIENCKDPYEKPKEQLLDCVAPADNKAHCRKVVGKNGLVVRECIPVPIAIEPKELCSTKIMEATGVAHCSLCNKDGCNGAGLMTASAPIAFFALFATYLNLLQH